MNYRQAVAANAEALKRLTMADLGALLHPLRQAEREMARGLARYFKGAAPDAPYTMASYRSTLAQLKETIRIVEHELGPATASRLKKDRRRASDISLRRLRAMVEAGSREFEGIIRPLRLDVAAHLTTVDKMLWREHEASAARYAGAVGRDIRRRLIVGVIKGETNDQIASRLLSGTGLVRQLKREGIREMSHGVAANVFGTYRSWADRLVQTEVAHAYGVAHQLGLEEADGDDPGYQKRWNAANDRRVCIICDDLDGQVVDVRAVYKNGQLQPPAHPRCRCCSDAWRRSWRQVA